MQFLDRWWPHVTGLFVLAANLLASGHALLRKRDTRAAIAWVGLVWLAPGVGATLYLLLGVNRIRKRALHLLREPGPRSALLSAQRAELEAKERDLPPELCAQARLVAQVSRRPLLAGNRIEPLFDGDQAYPAMLAAIEGARSSVALCTYIFDDDPAGRRFVEALARARARGVEVRVLVDGMGVKYSQPPIDRALRRAGLTVARFLPTLSPASLAFFNLRNHRKVLVVDGAIGFTGGMNIRHGHLVGENPRSPIRDLHFRLQGPVVAQLQASFAEDWHFTTGELLAGERWFPPLAPCGRTLARVVPDGPDFDDLEVLRAVLLGALAMARESVRVITPYFLPDAAMISALAVAAMRGVRVHVLLPGKNNIPPVQWASAALLWQVQKPGCRVFLSPPPFDHSKLMVVDRQWTIFGSTNWDPRSLRLNFEVDVECYDPELAARLDDHAAARIAISREITLADSDGRPLPTRLRDGFARLFSPYL